ncbi:alpha-tocopherol transfer protein-like isoform X1 [Diabrotica virgifera virgifera]|uniref:CRAL-TRIO domain-containing protein n=1 Tax=Diabrotica virgifera virgifera TaxID=50390 RepID=A0ABM5KPE9_DIAVI|nr:alpha-tocopherol transfer protein-like isoform X1 [Diabrotica virgifera virgifera]
MVSDVLSLKSNLDEVLSFLGKTKDDLARDVNIISKWLQTQNHLPELPSFVMIQYFLINNKFSTERTKQALDMYYSVRSLMPKIFRNSGPTSPAMKYMYDNVSIAILPHMTPNLHRVLIAKILPTLEEFNSNSATTAATHFYEIKIWEDNSVGNLILIDYRDLRISHVPKFTRKMLKQVGFLFEELWASDMKEMHIINAPNYAESLITLYRKYLHKGLREKIYVHKAIEDLFKYIPQEILPREYGGKEKPLFELSSMYQNLLKQYQHRFDKLDNMVVQENLRPSTKNNDILGYYGNYMQIDVN